MYTIFFILLICYLIIRPLIKNFSNSQTFFSNSVNNDIFFTMLFSMFAKLAKADGKVSKDEIIEIENIINHQLKLDQRNRDIAKKAFREAKENNKSIYQYAREFANLVNNEEQILVTTYRILWSISMSDRTISEQENKILYEIPEHFGINHKYYNFFKSEFMTNDNLLSYHYEILNCKPEDSDNIIKKNYRKLSMKYHPDRMQAKGLPKELLEESNKQMKNINKAYQIIMQHRKNN